MQLSPLIPSVYGLSSRSPAPPDANMIHPAALASMPCCFCGVRSGRWQRVCVLPAAPDGSSRGPLAVCPLCDLTHHLDRPRIDEEALLIWLPEMSQQALNAVMREVHMQLRCLHEGLHPQGRLRLDAEDRHAPYHARAALLERAVPAASRLGTNAPSDLAAALARLSSKAFQTRATLLGGLRLLPQGRLFEDGQDVYPLIVDEWLSASQAAVPAAAATH